MPLDLTPFLQAIKEACEADELPPLLLLIGTLTAAKRQCLQAVGERLLHFEKVSQRGVRGMRDAERVSDLWLPPKEGARRLGISVRTLTRRSTKPPYSAFCVPQPRGFKVSQEGLEDFQRRARR